MLGQRKQELSGLTGAPVGIGPVSGVSSQSLGESRGRRVAYGRNGEGLPDSSRGQPGRHLGQALVSFPGSGGGTQEAPGGEIWGRGRTLSWGLCLQLDGDVVLASWGFQGC